MKNDTEPEDIITMMQDQITETDTFSAIVEPALEVMDARVKLGHFNPSNDDQNR